MGQNPTAGVPVRAAARAILGHAGIARPEAPGRRAAVALLLATALLVCHGLFGASHVLWHGAPPQAAAALAPKISPGSQAHGSPDGTLSGAHHAAVPGEEGQEAPSGPLAGAAEYFAVLLALAGAALLAAFFRSRRSDPTPARLSPATRTVARTLPLSRGPSPPLLQVFRL